MMLATLFIVIACDRHATKDRSSSDISLYVNAFPAENQAANASLRLEFSLPFELLNIDGDLVTEKVFEFKPKIKGKTYRAGESVLLFQPDRGVSGETGAK